MHKMHMATLNTSTQIWINIFIYPWSTCNYTHTHIHTHTHIYIHTSSPIYYHTKGSLCHKVCLNSSHAIMFAFELILLRKVLTPFIPNYFKYWPIGIMVRMFVKGLGYWGSIPGQVIPKTQKWYLMPPFNIRHCKVHKVEWSRERSSTFPYTL